ncbi:hypothetical protein NDA16_003681 [Ustilago loliicola]|nr:hypothetical protein NDA16_003681 [Ustilago loliicola]
MPKQSLPACKTKWTEISRDRKQALALSCSASGIVEYTIQLMIAQDKRNREDDIRYQEEHLKVIKEKAEISREQTNIQRQMVEMGSAFLDTMKANINSVKSKVQLMSN